MTEQQITEQVLIRYNDLYRDGTPIITDEEYDRLVDNYKKKFPDSPFFKRAVIKQSQKESRKEKLPISMYSLDKCKSIEEVKKWLISNKISEEEILIITPKYDGISLVTIESEDQAWTRGDGEVGQQSHIHFSKMNDKHCGVDIIAFGEAIMSKKNFEKYKEKFANPRNLVAGLFNRDEAGKELKDVDYIRYGVSDSNDKINQIGALNLINEVECKYLILRVKEFFTQTTEFIEQSLTELYKDWSKDYNIDGLVVDINSKVTREKLGREENMNPKYARAIKLPKWSEEATVKVTGVTWQVSKQGKLKPVIQIEPTELAGVTISNVTGYNAKYVFDNNIAEDSIIKIVRSGDVIPKHIETIAKIQYYLLKQEQELGLCPSCKSHTKWDETFTELLCTNPECKEMKIMKLVHFFNVLEIEDFGEPSIRTLYNYGWETLQDILTLKRESLIVIDGFAEKSANKLLVQFERLSFEGVPFAKLLHALDYCDGKIGEKTIQLILDNIDEDRLLDLYDIEELVKINGISYITANIFIKAISKFFEKEAEFQFPVIVSYFQTPKQEVTGDKYKGMKLCFTGCRPTKEQEQEIQSQGGEIVSGVSKTTTHLVVKDISSSSSKTQKAKELGIKIISYNEFEKLL